MLCSRPSIKDVTLPRLEDKTMTLSSDPLSPKLGCMGQVKRNNKIVGLPSSNKLTIASKNDASYIKYSKLKRIFSGRNLGSNTSHSLSAPKSTSTCRRKEVVVLNGGFRTITKCDYSKESCVPISIDEMDPPLPVIKKEPRKGSNEGEADSLWKRRSGGVALKGLQLQQVQLNRHQFTPTTV